MATWLSIISLELESHCMVSYDGLRYAYSVTNLNGIAYTFTFSHLANLFIQSDLQMTEQCLYTAMSPFQLLNVNVLK